MTILFEDLKTLTPTKSLLNTYFVYVDLPDEPQPDEYYKNSLFWKYYKHVKPELILKHTTDVDLVAILQYQNINIDKLIKFFIKNIHKFSTTQQDIFFNNCLQYKPIQKDKTKKLLMPFLNNSRRIFLAIEFQNFDLTNLPPIHLASISPKVFTNFYLEAGYIDNKLLSNLKTATINNGVKYAKEPLKSEPNIIELFTNYTTFQEVNWEKFVFYPLHPQQIFNQQKITFSQNERNRTYFEYQQVDVETMFFKPTILTKNIKLFQEFINVNHMYTHMPRSIFLADYMDYWFYENDFFIYSKFSENALEEFFSKINTYYYMVAAGIVQKETKQNEGNNENFREMLIIHCGHIATFQNISEDFAIKYRQYDLISFGSPFIKFTEKILPFKHLLLKKHFLEFNEYITEKLFVNLYDPIFYKIAERNEFIKPSWFKTYYETRINFNYPPIAKKLSVMIYTNFDNDEVIARNINNHIVDPTTLSGFLERNPTWFSKICKYEICSPEVLEILFIFAKNNPDSWIWLLKYQSLTEQMLIEIINKFSSQLSNIIQFQILSQRLINMLVIDTFYPYTDILDYQIVPLEAFISLGKSVESKLTPLTLSEKHVDYLSSKQFGIQSIKNINFSFNINYNTFDQIKQIMQMIYNPLYKPSLVLIKKWFPYLFAWVNFNSAPDDLLETLNDVENFADQITKFVPVTSEYVVKYRLFTENTIRFTRFDEASFWSTYFYMFEDHALIFLYQKFSLNFLQNVLLPVRKQLVAIVKNKNYNYQELTEIKESLPKYKWPIYAD